MFYVKLLFKQFLIIYTSRRSFVEWSLEFGKIVILVEVIIVDAIACVTILPIWIVLR